MVKKVDVYLPEAKQRTLSNCKQSAYQYWTDADFINGQVQVHFNCHVFLSKFFTVSAYTAAHTITN